jgi:alpha-2-macroglobulin
MAQFRSFFTTHYRITILIAMLLLLISSGFILAVFFRSRSAEPGQNIPVSSSTSTQGGLSVMESNQSGIPIRLSEGKAQPKPAEIMPVADGDPLSESEIQQVLARAQNLPTEPEDQLDFRIAQDPIPPPQTGETIQESFPPPVPAIQPEAATTAPLEVLRFGPEGEISIAPFVNITFNQPMVPLTTLEELSIEQVPVQVEPVLPGTWGWLGTKTLTFQYDSDLIDRLPKATEYRITIPAGTRSINGGLLAETVEWTFTTPPAQVVSHYPGNEPQPLDPVFFFAFDQRIDPEAVLAAIDVFAGARSVDLKLATGSDVDADKHVARLVKETPEGRWLAFKAVESLPPDTNISVQVGPGIPSAEGPRVTEEAEYFTFYTYAPLRIERHGCAWSESPCRPMTPFHIDFNNPIDPAVYQESFITIQPELPGASVNIYGDILEIQGASQGQTTYTVTVSGELQDIFGQKLGKEARLSFRVGTAEPVLFGSDKIFITLDPAASNPIYSVYTINYTRLDVKIYAVQPSDWPAFRNYLREYGRVENPPIPPGNLVFDKSIPVESASDTLTEVGIDLSEVMDGEFGHFVVLVSPPRELLKKPQPWMTINAWIQITRIGLDAFADHSEMVAWTTDLRNGSPLAGVSISSGSSEAEVLTGEDGMARFPIPDGATYLVARQGADQAMLPRTPYYWDEGAWSTRSVNDELRWYVFDDRQMYRPGEEVHIKGWLRRIGAKQDGDVGLVGDEVQTIQYRIIEPQGNEIGSGRVDVNSLAGFDFVFTIPENVNLGYANITLDAQGSLANLYGTQYYHSFQIQEFRRPEFEVTARAETEGPYFAGGEAVVAVDAKYYAGGPLPNAEVTWNVASTPGTYRPPNWPDFTFGIWKPWWFFDRFYGETGMDGGTTYETFTGFTDAAGSHYLRLDFPEPADHQPYSVRAEGTVMDVNRQAWTGTTNLLVHPANLYVGMRSERVFVERGTPLKIDLIVTDLDGAPVADRPVEVQAARLEWKYRGEWVEEEADLQNCQVGSGLDPVSCTFETPLGGKYTITAQVTDGLGRVNLTQLTRWVSGGQQPPARKVEQETVTLIPDKETYLPGDLAHVLVQSPFSPAEGLLTVSRSGILYTERFRIEDGTITLDIPIQEMHIPNLNVQVDLAGSAQRSDDKGEPLPDIEPRPAFASGQLSLSIPPHQRTLSLQATPREAELEPGGNTVIDLLLNDASGQPVSEAELAVVVVDEAILSLTNYQLADPLSIFYLDRPSDLTSLYSRSSIILADPLTLARDNASTALRATQSMADGAISKEMYAMEMPAAAPMEAAEEGVGGEQAQTPIRTRIDFNPLAVFAPTVRTDAQGKATVEVRLPDNLTRYRIMVVAVAGGNHFGIGEANLTARLPLMVRPSAPRFLNFGDSFDLPVVLQNQTGEPMLVDVVIQVANLELTASQGLRVEVPARDRVEVRFPATTIRAGIARFQVVAVAGDYADAAQVELPVYTPATTEAFATYGVVDEGAIAQPVATPDGVFPQYGGLEINTSSTALQSLTDAVLYLVSYPFECSEQLASRILAVAALRDVLTAFEAEGLPSPEEMEAAVSRDIEVLRGLQNDDGGYPYWWRGADSIPFNTIHVAHALQRAKMKGFEVPQETQQRLRDHLRNIESYYPHWYHKQTRWTLSAYALYVRDLMGDGDPVKAMRLLDEAGLEQLSLDATGWLWPVLQDAPGSSDDLDAIRLHVNNRVVETAGAANFTTAYDDQTYLLLSSDRRTDAILLDALIDDSPEHDLIPKLVNGLLAHRTRGRWGNTQENVFVLLALDRYFNTYESQTPDFVARIWLGDAYAGEHEFRGRTTERHETLIPMSYLVDESHGSSLRDLVLSKDGEGRLYYRLGLRYAPDDLELDPLDMGFVVQRSYEALDAPEDVYQDDDGVWHVKAGTRLRVRISMVADNRRYHVALVDPIPAGLEIINPTLAVSGSVPQDPTAQESRYGWWWWGPWYEHQNLRDERAEAFTPLLWDGVYEYSYIARATTPGRFIVPPAKAEEMYSPEVFGRSSSMVVIVE